MIRIAIALLGFGGMAKLTLMTYRKIKTRQFFSKQTMPKGYYKGGFQQPAMSRREALLILNLREGCDDKQIKDNHRKIMLSNHPDNEGSTFLATKINEAKELILKQ